MTRYLALIAILSIVAQIGFRSLLPAEASLAGANGLSAALGLANGDGMTIAVSEGMAIKRQIEPDQSITSVYDPSAKRLPLIEPLPGTVLIFYLIGLTGLPFSLNTVTLANMLILAFGAALLGHELSKRSRWLGITAAAAVAGFVPMYRMTIVAGYDMYEFMMLMAAVIALLKYERTRRYRWLILDAVFVGIGLWMRSYFLLYVAAHALIVVLLMRRERPALRSVVLRMAGWAAPVLILAGIMISVRDSGSTGTPLTRGAFWHMFWMGVGQFENDEISGATDWDSCELARRLGHPVPCDASYEDDSQPYLFQYDPVYNDVLGTHASGFISDHPFRLVANSVGRVVWLAAPGIMPSSRIEARPVVRGVTVILSITLLLLALFGCVRLYRRMPDVLLILGMTYAALLPLTPYYLNAKVVAIPYFCVLVAVSAGLVELGRRLQSRP